MVNILGLSAIGWPSMLQNWWNKLLLCILIITLVTGLVYASVSSYRKYQAYLQTKRARPFLSPLVALRASSLKDAIPKVFQQTKTDKPAKSFGVYLGRFQSPPTEHERHVLSLWDVTVVDPTQSGVYSAVSAFCTSQSILGRLDVRAIANTETTHGNPSTADLLESVVSTLIRHFIRPQSTTSPYTGVLLANWSSYFPPIVCNLLIQLIDQAGLPVYVELSEPEYLTPDECRHLDLETAKGIFFRNGTIMFNGDRRNYFQMANMRKALRALAAQSQMSPGDLFMWETVGDNVQLDHGVVKRSYNWCRYYSAMNWIGPERALTDARAAHQDAVLDEPLSALSWVKDDHIVKLQERWRLMARLVPHGFGNEAAYDSLNAFIPHLSSKLSLTQKCGTGADRNSVTIVDGFDWPIRPRQTRIDPFAFSPHGESYTGLGCFQLGLDCSMDDFAKLADGQRRLRDLNLLQAVKSEKLHEIADRLRLICDRYGPLANAGDLRQDIEHLVQLLQQTSDDKPDGLKVYMGLHSGFRTSLDNRFWGIYDFEPSGQVCLYISLKAVDLAGTILHTYLSSRQYNRIQCFLAEVVLGKACNSLSQKWKLPQRVVSDIEGLTPTEAILLLRRADPSFYLDSPSFSSNVRACCEYQLLQAPSLAQQRELNSEVYLSGKISAQELVLSRLRWYSEQGCPHPEAASAVALFEEIDTRLPVILFDRQEETLAQLRKVIDQITQKPQFDAAADLLCLSIFCAFRRLAITEIYLEILDRNPLPNQHPDQAACFAEMFALGARCQAYFDMTPNAFGRILTDRYNAYFKINQPPARDDKTKELPTAYASKQVDLNLDAGEEKVPIYYQITFLGIFAFPALVDILLLTTIGRGLYLSSYMSEIEKMMATNALMIALFLTGAIGTWIGTGGSYYLHSMAFPAMNMYVLTRWIGGIAICFAGGSLGFIVVGLQKGPYAAMVFIFYLIVLTTYLCTLATLAIYQLPGFMFESGRSTVMACIPILFISPIATLWVKNEFIVYACVLSIFLVCLLVGAGRVASRWTTWYLNIDFVSDNDIVKWYRDTQMAHEADLPPGVTDISLTPLPRIALMEKVEIELNRPFWKKATTDAFILKVTKAYPAAKFLMHWYCMYSRTEMPYAHSTTWNLQCKAAADTLKDMQKGLKLHSAFVHWRQTGDEIYCGVLYFVIALMDKWVAIITGASIVGLSGADSAEFRLPIGFALAYYLISAIFLDAVAQPLWPKANKMQQVPVTSLANLREVMSEHGRVRHQLYWTNLVKFFLLHVWGLTITTVMMWVFDNNEDAAIMYLAYMGAYTGLLVYQYSRIFAGVLTLSPLLIAAAGGLLVGPLLHHYFPEFAFSSVIALAVSTWTAAISSFFAARIGRPKFSKRSILSSMQPPVFFSGNALGLLTVHSQKTMSRMYDSVQALPAEKKLRIDPNAYTGQEVSHTISSIQVSQLPRAVRSAIPFAQQLINRTLDAWHKGEILVDLVPSSDLAQEKKMKYISCVTSDKMHLSILLGSQLDPANLDVGRICKMVAETLLQASAELDFKLSRDHASLTQLLVSGSGANGGIKIPESITNQLDTSPQDCAWFIRDADTRVLRHFLLDLDCDRYWDRMPMETRTSLLRRCLGQESQITRESINWICQELGTGDYSQAEAYVKRCNLEAQLVGMVEKYASDQDAQRNRGGTARSYNSIATNSAESYVSTVSTDPHRKYEHVIRLVPNPLKRLLQGFRVAMKFWIISVVADPEFQRELDFVLSKRNVVIRLIAGILLNGTWTFCKSLQDLILPLIMVRSRKQILKLQRTMRGIRTTLNQNKVIIEGPDGDSTCFISMENGGVVQLRQYSGEHTTEPDNSTKLIAVNDYNSNLVLSRRQEHSNGSVVREYVYEHRSIGSTWSRRLPYTRKLTHGSPTEQFVQYNTKGYIQSGSYVDQGNFTKFTFWYPDKPKYDDDLLRAEYVLPHITITVSWFVPARWTPDILGKAVPNARVVEAKFVEGSKVYHSRWTYDHKSHPIINTTLNGEDIDTPPMIEKDQYKVLKKPTNCNFAQEDPLLSFRNLRQNAFSRFMLPSTKYHKISTPQARTHLWKSWKTRKDVDAVTARWLDEWKLRAESELRPYWNARDIGRFGGALVFLDENTRLVMAKVDIDPDISAWTPYVIKTSDLYTFGQGGDTIINTRDLSTQIKESRDRLHALALDTGTWPNEGGGVSACRRDMVNDLRTVRWHVVSENANDYGFPKFQIERNVQSVSILPLWGMDYLTPSHGIFQNNLDAQIQEKSHNTSDLDIRTKFIPILTTLVRLARAIKLDHKHIEEGTQALLDLNKYFESSRHWSDIWMSEIVKNAWRELWLTEDMENARPISQWMEAECPSIFHMDNALDMWQRYLFVFSLPVPETVPDVVQASHHFAGASYGILCKIKRGCAFHVWDHCISWREVTVFLSSAMSFDAPFVCTSLMQLSRMLSVLTLHHADVVLPCADFFNPGWEVELGSVEGTICHRKTFARKIDPVVNGICNMEKFEPIKKITTDKPTAVMLSHVRFVKDIKNAILAADIIINEWGLKDYRLDIYGDMERAPAYSTECQEIIAAKGLRDFVILRGLGNPSKVLETAWLFLNSSVSEGLPLAMGEAALTGVPVVCTDVGASFRVVTDMETMKPFSAVCPPNDSYALARAQVNIMALLDNWSEFAEDPKGFIPPELPLKPTAEQTAAIAKRMYDKAEHRRRLGMKGRANVLSNFTSERYLREHEQMLWLAKQQSRSFESRTNPSIFSADSEGTYCEKAKGASYVWSTKLDL